MSWAGALSRPHHPPPPPPPARPAARLPLLAAAFHLTVWALFPIGMCPGRSCCSAHPLLPPRLAPPPPAPAPRHPHRLPRPALALATLYLTLQLLIPLRHHLYPGPVDWTEEGFRFAWRVMLIHKTGRAELRVVTPERTRVVHPSEHLTALQHEQMVTQPDLIHAFAHELARRERAAGHRDVRVYADAWVSLNGRPARRIIDPTIDLAAEPRTSFTPARYILPLDDTPPP
ncbi:MAG: HTTM domain-containing protein [bacterium]